MQEYESYESMAEKKLLELCELLRTKWPLHNVAIWHRLGVVEPTEASVVIAITSEHRNESLEAVEVSLDFLNSSLIPTSASAATINLCLLIHLAKVLTTGDLNF